MGELPLVGLGTMGIEDPDTIETAVDVGYRHLDTAQIYENESAVGDGVTAADVARENLFVATKVWADKLAYDDVLASTAASLDRLGVEAVDLLYVHRPIDTYDPGSTLQAFNELHDEGLIRHVGVSNFSVPELEVAQGHFDSSLFAHQTELHPLFHQSDIITHAQQHDYWVVAYSPLASGKVFEIPELLNIADAYNTSPAAVSIAWLLSKDNVVVIPKASSRGHMQANLEAAGIDVTDDEVAAIDAIEPEEELFPE